MDDATHHPPDWNPRDDEEIVEIASCEDDAEAAGLATALAEAGVPCRVVQGGAGLGGGGLPLGTRTEPKIWVREHDLAAARTLVQRLRDNIEAGHGRPHEEE